MKAKPKAAAGTAGRARGNTESSKLASLLALAAGAAAVPQTGSATIIYDGSGATISPGGLNHFSLSNLPGTALFSFRANYFKTPTLGATSRSITGGQKGGYVRMRPALFGAGVKWNQATGTASGLRFATAKGSFTGTRSAHSPGSYSHEYLSFEFEDSTAGNAMRYGWVEVSLVNGDPQGGLNDFPQFTIEGWAYDNTGVMIATGQTAAVPEPSSAALLALGALALGAKGVRAWRRNRPRQEDPKAD